MLRAGLVCLSDGENRTEQVALTPFTTMVPD